MQNRVKLSSIRYDRNHLLLCILQIFQQIFLWLFVSMASWYECVCCDSSKSTKMARLKQKKSQKEIKKSLQNELTKWSKNTSIIIIGAGHAGIHMALLLIQSGYTNVKILERKHKFGGRTLSIHDRKLDIYHELGTCFIDKTNDKELLKLIDKFDKNNKLIQVDENKEFAIHQTNDNNSMCTQYSYSQWIQIQKNKINPKSTQINEWFPDSQNNQNNDHHDNVTVYRKLYENIFGDQYANNDKIHIPPKPTTDKLQLINMNFLQFLLKNNLEELIPTFILKMSCNGYGNLNDIPAFYGLWYNKPNTLKSVENKIMDRYILSNGLFSVFKNIVNETGINIVQNVILKSIDRHIEDKDKKIEIKFHKAPSRQRSNRSQSSVSSITSDHSHHTITSSSSNSIEFDEENKAEIIECDILFIACDMSQIRTANEEKEIYGNMDTYSLCCTLFQCDMKYKESDDGKYEQEEKSELLEMKETKGFEIWPEKLLKQDSHLFALRNSGRLCLKDEYYKICKEKKLKKEKLVAYQFSNKMRKNGTGKRMKEILIEDLKKLGKQNVEILKQRVMRYFPHFNQYGINKGYPWRVQNELQGKHKNTYYIGRSQCFDSIESELRYNIQLKSKLNL